MDFGAYILDDDALEQEFTLVTDAANLARASAEKRMLPSGARVASMMIASVGASFERRSSRIAFPMRLRTASFICICSRRLRCPSAASSVPRRSCAGSLPEGMLCPNEFVPLFERDGVIAELDFYMFCQVCALLKRWEREGRPLFCVSVNVSRSNFDVFGFFARYERHIAENQVPARYLDSSSPSPSCSIAPARSTKLFGASTR